MEKRASYMNVTALLIQNQFTTLPFILHTWFSGVLFVCFVLFCFCLFVCFCFCFHPVWGFSIKKNKTKQNTKQNKTKQNKTKQSKAKQSKAKQSKAKQSKTKQNKTKQNKTKQNKTKQNKTKQNKTKQNKTKTKQKQTQNKTNTKNKTKRAILPIFLANFTVDIRKFRYALMCRVFTLFSLCWRRYNYRTSARDISFLNSILEKYIAQFRIMNSPWFGLVWFGHGFIKCLASDLLLCPFHKELINFRENVLGFVPNRQSPI